MKKFLACFLIGIGLLGITACGDNNDQSQQKDSVSCSSTEKSSEESSTSSSEESISEESSTSESTSEESSTSESTSEESSDVSSSEVSAYEESTQEASVESKQQRVAENNYAADRDTAPDKTTRQVVRGNSKSKIYHVPGQRDYENMANSKYLVEFNTVQEAQAAGYRPAKR